MARFPQGEPEIAALALQIMDGLTTATEDFPSPPVSAEELQTLLDAYQEAKQAAVMGWYLLRQHPLLREQLKRVPLGDEVR